MSRLLPVALLTFVLFGCGTSTPPPQQQPPPATSGCEAFELVHAVSPDTSHLSTCTETCGNGLNPPTSGPHCGQTAPCRVFDAAQPDCQWIHNLEHGHVVLLYNCPGGCPDLVAELRGVWEASGSPKRILVTPWPQLQKKVAAVVWGWSWSGDTFDRAAIDCVLAHQDEEAPEPNLACAQ